MVIPAEYYIRMEETKLKKYALLIVDVQHALMMDHPYGETTLVHNLNSLRTFCYEHNIPVIYIQHDGGPGDDLEEGSEGWKIYSEVAPLPGDLILRKHYNSAFKSTSLHDILTEQQITHLIIGGLQTEYCIDATIKSAFDRGYHILVPEGTTSTFDNDFFTAEELCKYYEKKIWKKRFVCVLPLGELTAQLFL